MAAVRDRPISPHLTIWRWGPGMAVSILHRITGAGLTIVGLAVLTWWLIAASGGSEGYDTSPVMLRPGTVGSSLSASAGRSFSISFPECGIC